MGEFPAKLGIEWHDLMNMGRENPGTQEKFSMSVFALNTCQEANGVSWLHGEVSKKMFQGVWKGYSWEESHVSYVTNGVHMPTWAASEWKSFYNDLFGAEYLQDQSNEKTWAPILPPLGRPRRAEWRAHLLSARWPVVCGLSSGRRLGTYRQAHFHRSVAAG